MEDDFEVFWREYPKRDGNPKKSARSEWERLRKAGALPELDTILFAVRAYTRHLAKEQKLHTPYVAHTRTWLHQKRWEDFLPRPSPAPIATAAVLPPGFEDEARLIIAKIGPTRYMAYLGKAKWTGDDESVCLSVSTPFERQTIEINYQEELERLTGKMVKVQVGGIPA